VYSLCFRFYSQPPCAESSQCWVVSTTLRPSVLASSNCLAGRAHFFIFLFFHSFLVTRFFVFIFMPLIVFAFTLCSKTKRGTFFSLFYSVPASVNYMFVLLIKGVSHFSDLCVVVMNLKNVGCGIEVLIGVAYIAMMIVTLLIKGLLSLTLLQGINLCTTKTRQLLSPYVSLWPL